MTSDASLVEGEQLVLKLHPHWKTLLRPLLVLALVVLAALAALILLPLQAHGATIRLAIGAAALLAAIAWFLVPLLRWRSTSYELTTRRLRLRDGVLTRVGRDFPLSRISDVSFSQGLTDRIIGCGRLIVESPGEHGQLVLTEIPRVKEVQALLFQLVGDEQQRLAREER
jgi:uncharacterized membrane protein YdbT with pleckstrin-like domain